MEGKDDSGRGKRIMSSVLSTLKSFQRDIQLEEMSEAGQKRAQLNARLEEKFSQQNAALFLSSPEREWHTFLESITTKSNDKLPSANNSTDYQVTLTEPCIYYRHAGTSNLFDRSFSAASNNK